MPRSRIVLMTVICLVVLGMSISAFAQVPAAPAAAGQRGGGAGAAAGGGGGRGAGGAGGGAAAGGAAAPARNTRPPLFFKEVWKQNAASNEHPITQESIASPTLELKLYGSTAKDIDITGNANDDNNPIHAWTGVCTTTCALALRDKANFADLTGLARIKWVIKTSGFHEVHPVLKLADGTYLVGDHGDAALTDWLTREFSISDIKWLKMDPERVVTTGNYIANPDLSKVDEIGFTELTPGSGHGAGGWIDVAAFEVYAKSVPR